MDVNISTFILQEIIQSVIETLEPYGKINNNVITVKMSKKSIIVRSDEMKIRQILFNLVTNACKHSEDSTIKLIISQNEIDDVQLIILNVKDTGVGIPKNRLKDISEIWGSEVSLLYPELYAGTTDLVCVYKGEPAIIDFKQARKLKKKEWVEDYYLQLVAYAEAHNKMYGTQIKTGRVFICTQNNEFQTFNIDNYDHWAGQWYNKLEQYYKSIL